MSPLNRLTTTDVQTLERKGIWRWGYAEFCAFNFEIIVNSTSEVTKKPGSILLATSDSSLLSRLSMGLRDAGVSVTQTADGQVALEFCLTTPPSLAILDYELPIVAGIEIAERLRTTSPLPVVMLSSSSDESIVNRAFDAGAMTYLIKPVSTTRLISTIETAMRRFIEIKEMHKEADRLAHNISQVKATSIAVGILMATLHISEKDAHDRLRSFARSKRSKVNDVALELLTHSAEFNSVVNRIRAISHKARSETERN